MTDAIFSDIQTSARNAYTEMISRLTVVVATGSIQDSCASGVLCRTLGGNPVILTARHVFDDRTSKAITIHNETIGSHEGEYEFHRGPKRNGEHQSEHKYIDVAVIVPSAHLARALEPHAGVVIADDSETQASDVVVLCGYPSYLASALDRHPDLKEINFGRIVYTTGVKGKDPVGRLMVNWSDAQNIVPPPDAPNFPPHGTDVFKLGRPHGISGGGLWRVRSTQKSSIWSPSESCQLIGIASATRGELEFAEPVDLWSPWLVEVAKTINAANLTNSVPTS